jgi:hypothetical protein
LKNRLRHWPQPFFSAPGSVFGGHHSCPGGLPIHTSGGLDAVRARLSTLRAHGLI